jgi:hypothetical protein
VYVDRPCEQTCGKPAFAVIRFYIFNAGSFVPTAKETTRAMFRTWLTKPEICWTSSHTPGLARRTEINSAELSCTCLVDSSLFHTRLLFSKGYLRRCLIAGIVLAPGGWLHRKFAVFYFHAAVFHAEVLQCPVPLGQTRSCLCFKHGVQFIAMRLILIRLKQVCSASLGLPSRLRSYLGFNKGMFIYL